MLPRLRFLLSCVVLAGFAPDAGAQDSVATSGDSAARPQRVARPAHEQRAILVSFATHAPFKTRVGVRHRDVAMLTVRRSWRRRFGTRFELDYVVDLVPLAVSTNNPNSFSMGPCAPTPPGQPQGPPECEHVHYGRVYGFGAMPLGLQLVAPVNPKTNVVFGIGMGAVWFTRAIPDPTASQWNFLGEAGGGIEVMIATRRSLLVGYRRSHTSNAGTADVNPGLDAGMFYLGFGTR